MWNPTLTPYASPESTRGARWGAAPAPGLFNCHFTYTFYFCKQHKSKLKTPNKQTQQISINNLPLLWFCTNKSDIFRKRNCIFKAHKKNRQIQNDKAAMTWPPDWDLMLLCPQIMFLISEMFRYLKASTTLKTAGVSLDDPENAQKMH